MLIVIHILTIWFVRLIRCRHTVHPSNISTPRSGFQLRVRYHIYIDACSDSFCMFVVHAHVVYAVCMVELICVGDGFGVVWATMGASRPSSTSARDTMPCIKGILFCLVTFHQNQSHHRRGHFPRRARRPLEQGQ